GFRVIPEDEAEAITVKPGKEPRTLVLNHPAGVGTGLSRTYRRETVISETSHNVLERRIYGNDNQLLARAVVADQSYQAVAAGADGKGGKVNVPTKVKLEWLQEKLTLEVTLNYPKVNTPFNDARRAELFVEPPLRKGYERLNLAELAGGGEGGSSTSV